MRSSGSCCARSLNQPLMVIFEDLHWIDERDPGVAQSAGRFDRHRADPAVGELPSRILASVEQQDLLHATAARPAGQGECRGDAVGAARRRRGLVPLKRLIIERTEGNPFFMEEMVQVLFEEGVLQRNGSGEAGQADRTS